jgi:hypothetical protein
MLDPKTLDDLARRLADAVPPGMRSLRDELQKNFRAVLQATFAKLDLVTREEFDLQQAVLTRTREKLDGLIARLAELEDVLGATAPPKRRKRKKEND